MLARAFPVDLRLVRDEEPIGNQATELASGCFEAEAQEVRLSRGDRAGDYRIVQHIGSANTKSPTTTRQSNCTQPILSIAFARVRVLTRTGTFLLSPSSVIEAEVR